jgi:hypothetical protein
MLSMSLIATLKSYKQVSSRKLKSEIRRFVNGPLADYERLVERHGSDRVVFIIINGEPEIYVTVGLAQEMVGIKDTNKLLELRRKYLPSGRLANKIYGHYFKYADMAILPSRAERRWMGGGGAKARMLRDG